MPRLRCVPVARARDNLEHVHKAKSNPGNEPGLLGFVQGLACPSKVLLCMHMGVQ